jgi:hypothetical protein
MISDNPKKESILSKKPPPRKSKSSPIEPSVNFDALLDKEIDQVSGGGGGGGVRTTACIVQR